MINSSNNKNCNCKYNQVKLKMVIIFLKRKFFKFNDNFSCIKLISPLFLFFLVRT